MRSCSSSAFMRQRISAGLSTYATCDAGRRGRACWSRRNAMNLRSSVEGMRPSSTTACQNMHSSEPSTAASAATAAFLSFPFFPFAPTPLAASPPAGAGATTSPHRCASTSSHTQCSRGWTADALLRGATRCGRLPACTSLPSCRGARGRSARSVAAGTVRHSRSARKSACALHSSNGGAKSGARCGHSSRGTSAAETCSRSEARSVAAISCRKVFLP
mmetsp:Transcript_44479/g.110703  ORF Transcript_44479/g.110703 Transcript_44479/m.110703 type:complete len:218 (-) Transcript_44479:143-796(-)